MASLREANDIRRRRLHPTKQQSATWTQLRLYRVKAMAGSADGRGLALPNLE
jgi:hypothetical protein